MSMYLDPASIKINILEDIHERLTGGTPIVDANNVPMFFLEAFSTHMANGMLATKTQVDSLYKLRASTPEELYRHMSDYDYTGVYATPAPFKIVVELDKNYLVYNSNSYSDVYNRVVLPVNTVFSFGEYDFGIYYPINININKKTTAVTVEWDTSEDNSLYSLSNNSIEFAEVTEDGIDLIQIEIPVFQFKRTIATETVTPDTGFIKTYSFTDRFYALKAFNLNKNNSWEEIKVSLSETIYNVDEPSVRIIVNQDFQTVKVVVPSIYFSTEAITSQLRLELYTTKGELNVETSSIDADSVTHNFNITNKDTYSTVLDRMSGIIIYAASAVIIGGTNGITFSELKNRVINNTFFGDVITTVGDIEKYFTNLGFKASRYACNVTDLIYLCHKQLTNSRDEVISAGSIKTYMQSDLISNYSDTIYSTSDDSLTILPSTIYKYDINKNMCYPLTNIERNALLILSKENKVKAFNENYYTMSPFHIRLDRSTRYPIAYTYDLNNPSSKYLRTVSENHNSDYVIKAYAVNLSHDGINGYDIKFLLSYTSGITPDDIVVFFYTYSSSKVKIWSQATFQADFEDKWVYNVHIDTNYSLFKNNSIYLDTLRSDSGNVGFEVPLDTNGYLIIMVKSNMLSAEALMTTVGYNARNNFPDYTPIIEQSMSITLGKYLSGIYNNVDVVYKEERYLTYESNVYSVADRDIYRYDSDGNIEYSIDENNNITYIKQYSAGDVLLDENEQPIIKHAAGDVKLDVFGQPIVDPNYVRNVDYVIDIIHIDGKLNIVTDSKYTNIMNYTRSSLLSFVDTIDEAYNHLLNGTKLFFTPIRTIGTTNSTIGNGVTITHNLELTAHFKLYVYEYVYKNESLKESIRSSIISLIDKYTNDHNNNVIAMDAIVNLIKDNISEYVVNVDVFGFFGDQNIQTLICPVNEVKPHLKQYLKIKEDGVITIERGLTLDFVTI